MRLRCNDCGTEFELPEGFFGGAAASFWRLHGHPPGSITYICACGETRDSGPDTMNQQQWRDRVDAALAALTSGAADAKWYREHVAH